MHTIALVIVLFLINVAWAGRADRAAEAEQLFQMDRLLTIHINVSPQRWQAMQPRLASRLATMMAVAQHPTTQQAIEMSGDSSVGGAGDAPSADGERRPPGLSGYEYAYVGATVTIDGSTYENVGFRFKGQWSYALAGASPRRPLKLDFNRFVPGQQFRGVHSLSLNTNALDPSQLRESLGHAFFRDAGVPAPRTCFALVYLTVRGVYDREPLGLYTVVEEINKDFLDRHFGTTKGLLIRPERTRNLAYFGPRWEEYGRYNLQTDATPLTAGQFIRFTRLINDASEEYFCSDVADCLDVDSFIRFLAANVLMVNLDGVLVNGHNYYIHVHPKTGRMAFIPWDLHLGFGWHGRTLDEWVSLTIDAPYRNGNRFVERILMVGWMRDAYHERLREFATGCFAPGRMNARIEQLEAVVRRAEMIAQREGKKLPVSLPTSVSQPRAELKPFVAGRVQSVLGQLAGRVEGDPVTGRPPKPVPPPAPKPAPPAPAKTAPPAPAKSATPAPAKHGPAVAAKPALATAKPEPARAKPTPKPPPPVNPAASVVLSNIDGNRDGQLSREELADAAMHLYIAHRRAQGLRSDEAALAATLDHIAGALDPFPPSTHDSVDGEDLRGPRPALTWASVILRRAAGEANRRISLEGLIAAAHRMFDAADANRDGQLNVGEINRQMEQLLADEEANGLAARRSRTDSR